MTKSQRLRIPLMRSQRREPNRRRLQASGCGNPLRQTNQPHHPSLHRSKKAEMMMIVFQLTKAREKRCRKRSGCAFDNFCLPLVTTALGPLSSTSFSAIPSTIAQGHNGGRQRRQERKQSQKVVTQMPSQVLPSFSPGNYQRSPGMRQLRWRRDSEGAYPDFLFSDLG
jgi:hypothetical protein